MQGLCSVRGRLHFEGLEDGDLDGDELGARLGCLGQVCAGDALGPLCGDNQGDRLKQGKRRDCTDFIVASSGAVN